MIPSSTKKRISANKKKQEEEGMRRE